MKAASSPSDAWSARKSKFYTRKKWNKIRNQQAIEAKLLTGNLTLNLKHTLTYLRHKCLSVSIKLLILNHD